MYHRLRSDRNITDRAQTLIIHHNDNDGRFSAALVRMITESDVDYRETCAGKGKDLDDLHYYDRIIFVDLSPTAEELTVLDDYLKGKQHRSVCIFDHHASVESTGMLPRISALGVTCYYDTKAPGATGMLWSDVGVINHFKQMCNEHAVFVADSICRAIGAVDSRKWDYAQNNVEQSTLIASYCNSHVSNANEAYNLLISANLVEILDIAKMETEVNMRTYQRLASSAYIRTWQGLTFAVLNCPMAYSGILKEFCTTKAEEGIHVDGCIFWSYNPKQDKIVITVYDIFETGKNDLSKLMIQLGGGGHRGAAGAAVDWDKFPKELR